MKSIFRSTALLSGSSALSILISVGSTKVMATVLHPLGYGYYGLLQSFVGVGSLVAGLGMATGLVRLGARPAARQDAWKLANLRAGAWLLAGIMSAITLGVLAVFRVPLSRLALGSADHQWDLLLMGGALCFTVALNVQNGILSAWQKVGALAAYGVVNTAGSCTISVAAVCLWHENGVVPAVLGGAVAGWLTSRYFLTRSVPRQTTRLSGGEVLRSIRELLSFGIPFTASATLGTGIQLALPMLVVHFFDTAGVAYYKAALAISVNYLGFLLTAMTQDYYPRVSALRGQPGALIGVIHEQHRLILLLAGPMVLGTLALVPYLVPLVYSPQFVPAVLILEWQLIGDIFKFSAWTLSFAILAQSSPGAYLLAESIGGLSMLACTWSAVYWFGLKGLGIGFVAAYALYYVAVRTILRHDLPITESRTNAALMLSVLSAALIIRLLPSTSFSAFRTPIALLLAGAFGIHSVRILRSEYFKRGWLATALAPRKGRVQC